MIIIIFIDLKANICEPQTIIAPFVSHPCQTCTYLKPFLWPLHGFYPEDGYIVMCIAY